ATIALTSAPPSAAFRSDKFEYCPSALFTPSAPLGGRLSWYDFQLKPFATSWSAIVFPLICLSAGMDIFPSISVTAVIAGGVVSLNVSITGVAASVPSPDTGQFATESLSKCVLGTRMLLVQFVLCQSGELSFRIPKFDPPVISR